MQVAENRRILVCDYAAARLLKSAFPKSVLLQETGTAALFDVTEHEVGLHEKADSLGLHLSPRYMDRFYFCFGSVFSRDRRATLGHFFDVIAPIYSQYVDIDRNRDNVANLLQLVASRTDCPGPVLDFGCGTGLAKKVADAVGVELIGYEPNRRMRAEAVAAGLRVWDRLDVAAQCGQTLHAAMASYVLHLPGTLDDVGFAWRALLQAPAMFVANFHKSEGLNETVRIFQALGATIEAVDSPAAWRRHGDYVVFFRRRF